MHLPETRSGKLKLAGLLVAAAIAYLLFRRFGPDLEPQQILEDVAGTLGAWTYPLVSLLAFLETGAFVGLLAPGESFVVIAGAVAGQGETSVVLTIGLVWLSAYLGDTASFFLGQKLGRDFVLEHGERVRITRERFAQVESYFDDHGGKTILIGRFIGLVRALAPFIAGSSGMRYLAMAPYSVLGTGLWATFFSLLGYLASRNLDAVFQATERGLLIFGWLVALVVAGIYAVRYLRVAENREKLAARMEANRVGRRLLAVGRRLAPEARFLRDRLTPGGLGVEFTSVLAVLAVAGYLFFAYADLVVNDPAAGGLDRSVIDLVEGIRTGWLIDLQKGVSALGDGVVVFAVGAVAAIAFAVRRATYELAMLVVALGLLFLAVPELKEAIARPRPPGSLVETSDLSFPSGHATYSTLYAWLGLVVAIRLRPGWVGGSAVIALGFLTTILIGLSRVYLGAHFFTDVIGGWALGATIFGLVGAIGIAVFHIRKNAADEA